MAEGTYQSLLETLNLGNKAVVVTLVKQEEKQNRQQFHKLVLSEEDLFNSNGEGLNEKVYSMAKTALETGILQFDEEDTILAEPYYPEPQLIILGGGHIAKPLSELGHRAGFVVTVVDDRPTFANQGRFPQAERVICDSFESCFNQLNINKSSYVVIVTRGHRHDLVCLKETLKYTTAYTGMIGSKRRVKSVRELLLEEGYPEEQVARVNAPIGIDIGAVTPDEIAISIIAEVISHRRKGTGSNSTAVKKINWPEYDREVLEELQKGKEDPKALITILSTKGSVPRKAGAKMIVWPDGKILGSIGGGCSEADVITTAYDAIAKKQYMTKTVDMTGQVAEDEGMVCGGIMQVAIEPW